MRASPRQLILLSVSCSAIVYLIVGLPLAALPGWVTRGLGYGGPVAGIVISSQYAATIVSRAIVGPMVDRAGARRSVLLGFGCCMAGGIAIAGAAWLTRDPPLALAMLLLSRLFVGFGESLVSTSAIAWGIARVGQADAATVISWSGIATYGGIALGAPAGMWLFGCGGVAAVGGGALLLAVAGIALAWPQASAGLAVEVEGPPVAALFRSVLPYGVALALAGVGFGVTTAFVALDFAARNWAGAWIALSAFGIGFVASRLLFIGTLERHGSLAVAATFATIESGGLAAIWAAPSPVVAVAGAAMTGFGFAMIFPALGILVVRLAPPQSRASAIGAYTLFLDVSFCVAGPIAGLLVGAGVYTAPFLFGAIMAAAAATLLMVQRRRHARNEQPRR